MAEKIPLAVRRTIGDTTALEEFSLSDTVPLGNLPTLPLNKLVALTASRALVTSGAGIIEASAVTAIELGYLSGITSSVQTQLNTAASNLSSHTVNTSNPHATTAAQVGAPTTSGAGATGTWGIGISGNAATATTWATGRTLTIGDTGKSVDGSGNVSWSHAEIGATVAATANKIVLRDANASAKLSVEGELADSEYRRVFNPAGGFALVGSVTGALKIVLPVGMVDNFLSMTVRVYSYSSNTSFDLRVFGYNYSVGNTWQYNPTAYIIGAEGTNVGHTVRFGYTSGGKAVIYVGELSTSWALLNAWVTEVLVGFYPSSISYLTGWTIGYEGSAFEHVTATITATQVGYSTTSNTANAGVKRGGSGGIAVSDIISNSDTFRLTTARTPASASASGNTGEVCWDASYLYICTATNTWRRIAHATW
jgi:hypothetical protein